MEWVDRLVEVLGWDSPPGQLDWIETETTLGTPLPADFKEVCNRFYPRGAFADYLVPLVAEGHSDASLIGNHTALSASVRANSDNRLMFSPYGLFDGVGLLQWGYSVTESEYYWLADASTDPAGWPVIAREDPLEEFRRFDIPASEFIFRVLADQDFLPLTIAARLPVPYYRAF